LHQNSKPYFWIKSKESRQEYGSVNNLSHIFQYGVQVPHSALDAMTPEEKSNQGNKKVIDINHYQWKKHLHGLVQLPIAS